MIPLAWLPDVSVRFELMTGERKGQGVKASNLKLGLSDTKVIIRSNLSHFLFLRIRPEN